MHNAPGRRRRPYIAPTAVEQSTSASVSFEPAPSRENARYSMVELVTVPGSPPNPASPHDRSCNACCTLAETLDPFGQLIVSDPPEAERETLPALVVAEKS